LKSALVVAFDRLTYYHVVTVGKANCTSPGKQSWEQDFSHWMFFLSSSNWCQHQRQKTVVNLPLVQRVHSDMEKKLPLQQAFDFIRWHWNVS